MSVDNQGVERSSRQQVHIDAAPEAICGVVKGPVRAEEHELTIDRLEDCREVSIHCDGTGVTTRFVLADAQGGTFVEGYFSIEPNSVGVKVIAAVTGRRYLRSWLEQSLANLKQAAEQQPAPS
jgi:hypothetical protein